MDEEIRKRRMQVALKNTPTEELAMALNGARMELVFAKDEFEATGVEHPFDEEGLPLPSVAEIEKEIEEISRELALRASYNY